MASPRRARFRPLHLESLECRLAPSGSPWLTQSFNNTPAGTLPPGWSQWQSASSASVGVSIGTGLPGDNSLDISASTSQASAHAWYNVPASADVQVTAAVDVNSLIPAQILARGSNLDSAASTYYALAVTRGLDLQLVGVVNGATTVLADLKSAQWFSDQWVQATLQVQGTNLYAQIVRVDTGQYLNSAGLWQSGQTWALQVSDGSISQAGDVGFSRPASYTGTLHFDQFTATLLSQPATPSVSEAFDTTSVGSLPAGWAQYSSTGTSAFAVTNQTALSAPNSLAVSAAASTTSASAWLTATQAADVQVTAAVQLNALIPAQVLARGSALATSTPTYYALALTRGLGVQLLRVVNGTTTVLANLQSAAWFSGPWVRATLQVSGSSLSVQLVRADTGQYLSSSGQWQTAQAWALTATDTAITQAGLVGLARPASYTGTVNFDDFSVTNLSTAPPPPAGVTESFDTTSVGSLPAGWTQHSSSGNAAFQVTNTVALSAPNGLAVSAATSSLSAAAWLTAAQPANVQVTAAILLNALIPAEVLARGSGLNTSTPTYYALALTRGLDLQLLSVVNGTTTVLANLQSASWFSDGWVRATLYANGTNLRAQVYRVDTAQYLNASGTWQATQAWAINLNNAAISQGGNVGLARPASYTGTVVFDDFAVAATSGDSTPPTVSIVVPAANSTLGGVITVQANASEPGSTITRVEFYIDNVLRAYTTTAPYTWAFDTSTASNGTHQLTVLAYDLAGNIGQASLTIATQNNSSLARPTLPQHYPNIRIAELAYTGGFSLGAPETSLLQNSVDLVVADQSFAQQINAIAPNTPQASYINISNIYGSMLTSWLSYANANGLDPESAFYHVTQPTPFSGDSASSQPVDWFWSVARGSTTLTDMTSQAHGGGLALGTAGQSVYMGYLEPFNEIDVQLSTPAPAGWSAVLEYASSVDASGNPTGWTALTTNSNTTAGWTQSGRILFDPPSAWKMAAVNGSVPLYYVRLRTISGSTAPVAASLLTADYVNAAGGTSGVIPVFDYAADLNHDGYLNNAEYAVAAAAGDTARFAYQSRLFYPAYGQMRFVVNPSNATFRLWIGQYARSYLSTQPYDSALFVDNSGGNSPIGGLAVAEPTAAYTTDYASMLNEIGQAIAPHWILANIAGGGTSATAVVQSVQAYFNEFDIRPLAQTYQQFEQVAAQYAQLQALTSPAPYAVLDSLPTGGAPTDPRTEIATLAYYYLLADPTTTFLDFYGGYNPSSSWTQHWTAAAAYNIGASLGSWSVFATGTDPNNPALTYKVYERSFANALVLYQPLSTNASGTVVGSLSSSNTFALGGSYRPLQADGTLGAVVTSISLSNGQGAILVKA